MQFNMHFSDVILYLPLITEGSSLSPNTLILMHLRRVREKNNKQPNKPQGSKLFSVAHF